MMSMGTPIEIDFNAAGAALGPERCLYLKSFGLQDA